MQLHILENLQLCKCILPMKLCSWLPSGQPFISNSNRCWPGNKQFLWQLDWPLLTPGGSLALTSNLTATLTHCSWQLYGLLGSMVRQMPLHLAHNYTPVGQLVSIGYPLHYRVVRRVKKSIVVSRERKRKSDSLKKERENYSLPFTVLIVV